MKLFLDTANIDEIREINEWGVLKGVTTNPTLLARAQGDIEKAWRSILEIVDGDVSLETTEPEPDAMHEQGEYLASHGEDALVKVQMTARGDRAAQRSRP